MRRNRHINERAAFKLVFLLTGLSLFTTQVSGRYYRPSSQPVGRICHTCIGGVKHQPVWDAHVRGVQRLDKRYELKHHFSLLAPVIRMGSPSEPGASCATISLFGPVQPTWVHAFLRGPPVTAIYPSQGMPKERVSRGAYLLYSL